MVQGFWDVAVVDWLNKALWNDSFAFWPSEVGIPPESILHQAAK